MPLSDIFSREGGLFVVDLDDDALKLLTPSRKCKTLLLDANSYMSFRRKDLKPKKKKKKSKKKSKKTLTGSQDSGNVLLIPIIVSNFVYFDIDDESAMTPGLIDGSATSALEDAVSTDFGEFSLNSLKTREH
jgi:hypothetical protein